VATYLENLEKSGTLVREKSGKLWFASAVLRAVVVPERSGTPFRQIVLSWSGAQANVVGHRRNANTAAFRQIS